MGMPFGCNLCYGAMLGAGGGGGGTNGSNLFGGGGGGGGYATSVIAVTAGTTYNVTVGTGGTAGSNAGGNGGNGGFSWFNTAGNVQYAGGGTGGNGSGAGGNRWGWWQQEIFALPYKWVVVVQQELHHPMVVQVVVVQMELIMLRIMLQTLPQVQPELIMGGAGATGPTVAGIGTNGNNYGGGASGGYRNGGPSKTGGVGAGGYVTLTNVCPSLSGVYTIGGGGSPNFSSFSQAFASIACGGLSGKCKFGFAIRLCKR